MNKLEQFKSKKAELVELLDETTGIFKELKDESEVQSLEEIRSKLKDNNFKVLVIGEFKRGKSTFINALLQEEILPAYSVPCTAIINEIKFGDDKRAVIHFKQKVGQLPEGLASEIKDYIAKYTGADQIPPLTIPFDKLEDYVTITDVEKEQAESVAESPFEKAEIYVPLDLCRDGVEIIDSPGLNEHSTRNAVTNKYSQSVDAIIFVLLCQPLGSSSELESIEELRRLGHKTIFFVCNSFDLIRDKEKPRVIQLAKTRLGGFTDLGEKGLHFVSSLEALEARTEELDPDKAKEREAASNFPQMEADLKDFLVNDRGRIKLQLPAESIAQKLSENLRKKIAAKKAILEKQSAEMESRVAEMLKVVTDLEKREATNMDNLSGKVSSIENMIMKMTHDYINDVADRIPGWVEECTPTSGLGILITTKSDIENVSRELVDHATECIKEFQAEWQRDVLEPKVGEAVAEFKGLAEDYVKDFKSRMNEAEDELSGEASQGEVGIDAFYIDNGIDQSVFSDLVATAAPSVAVGIGMAFLGALQPWLLIPALLGAGGISRFFNKEAKMESIKKSVGQEFAQQVRMDGLNKLHASPEQLSERLNEIIARFKDVFAREIAGAQKRASQAVEDSRMSQQDADARRVQYDNLLRRAEDVLARNRAFTDSL